MKDGGRLAAAVDVLTAIESQRQPVQAVLKDWGQSHRFAGSGDRVAIGNLVFDALRRRSSLAWVMKSETPRSLVLATYVLSWERGLGALDAALADDRHAPEPVTPDERSRLTAASLENAPAWVRADVPEWLWPQFQEAFGADAEAEGRALGERAPIDLRVNTIKTNRDKVLKRLAHLDAEGTRISPVGIRLNVPKGDARAPHVQAEEGYRKGWFELQDEASQVAALLASARPGEQVLDLCAGGGGKTLALAAEMDNRGQIYAYDSDRLRLAPIHERLARAGARNVQVRDPKVSQLDDLGSRMDLVFIDAPCSGTGVWRRRPDSKWRLSANALAGREQEQAAVLREASRFVRPGGRLVYATCSLLPSENIAQVHSFLADAPDFRLEDLAESWPARFGADAPQPRLEAGTLTLSPARTATDGFFVAVLTRMPA